MKITIDTKEDSHDDLKRVINLLKHLLGESSNGAILTDNSSLTDPSEPSAAPSTGFFNMFGDDNKPDESSPDESLTESDTIEEEKPDDDFPEIIAY